MKRVVRGRKAQQGMTLIVMMTVFVMGLAWYVVGALGKAAPAKADIDIRSGEALHQAKKALLAYVAKEAARPDSAVPGRMPCPEPLSPGAGLEGIAAGCSTADANTRTYVGRLPWRTLGVDQIRDGDGEPLWYILGRGFRESPINFGSLDEIELDGVNRQAVALIIAPGTPLNTLADAGTPPAACPRVNQMPRIVVAGTRDPARFLECGRNSVPAPGGEPQYNTNKTSPWTNDRVIVVTAAEVMDAIAGPVADRAQRQVAALIGDWDQIELAATGRSWGATHGLPYLPFASSWSNPMANSYCGSQDAFEGLAPIDPTCHESPWTGTTVSTGGLNILGGGGGCSDIGTHLRCRYQRGLIALGSFTARIDLQAPNVGRAFRSTISASNISVSDGGSVTAIAASIPNSTSDATVTIDVVWPGILGIGVQVEVLIPHLQDAVILSDPRLTWFWNNQWQRYAYYAVAPGATVSAATSCASPAFTGCLTVNGLPASTGPANQKRLVLVLSGRPLPGQTQPSGNRSHYFEAPNDATDIAGGNSTFGSATVTATFNDRLAACPFQYTPQTGPTISICD